MPRQEREPFRLGEEVIAPGERRTVNVPLGRLSDHTRMNLLTHVVHGRSAGPVMFVSGAIHGDEIIGVEIIRRLSEIKALSRLRGTLLLVPIVNAYGFNMHSRYLPDRRDLNRSFPGTGSGSLAAQLAHVFMEEVVDHCDYGIDLHSAALHRDNLPQVRADLSHPVVRGMAEAFGTPIILDSRVRDGSLRAEAQERGCDLLLYEGGQALRFDERAIRIGVRGVVNVMRLLKLLPESKSAHRFESLRSSSSVWERAPIGGIMRSYKGLGDVVTKGELLAVVSGPLGEDELPVTARTGGMIIGRAVMPVVNRGDALFHIAELSRGGDPDAVIGHLDSAIESDPMLDGRVIV